MKRKYILLLLLLFLVGCSKITINKESFIIKIDGKFDSMLLVSKQELTSYGIDTTTFKDFIFKVSSEDPVNAYILVLPNDKKEAKKEIKKFLDKKKITKYYDNNFGDYLFYVVAKNDKEIYKEMNDFVNKK